MASVFLAPIIPVWAASTEPDQQEPNWPLCTDSLNIPARPVVDANLSPGDIHVVADDADLEAESVSTLEGNVEITRDDQQARADYVQFNQIDDTADLEGNVQYWDELIYLEADKAHIEFNNDTGQFKNTKYTIKDNRGRGKSADLEMKIGTETNLRDTDYSTCDPANKFWALSAGEIHLDHVEVCRRLGHQLDVLADDAAEHLVDVHNHAVDVYDLGLDDLLSRRRQELPR